MFTVCHEMLGLDRSLIRTLDEVSDEDNRFYLNNVVPGGAQFASFVCGLWYFLRLGEN